MEGTQAFPTSRPLQPPLSPGLAHSDSALSLHLVQGQRHPLRALGPIRCHTRSVSSSALSRLDLISPSPRTSSCRESGLASRAHSLCDTRGPVLGRMLCLSPF